MSKIIKLTNEYTTLAPFVLGLYIAGKTLQDISEIISEAYDTKLDRDDIILIKDYGMDRYKEDLNK